MMKSGLWENVSRDVLLQKQRTPQLSARDESNETSKNVNELFILGQLNSTRNSGLRVRLWFSFRFVQKTDQI